MDGFLRNIKNKFSADNIVSTENAKEPAKGLNLNRDEDVQRTLVKIDPNDIIHPEEVAAKLNEIHEHSKMALDELMVESNKVIDLAKTQSTKVIDSAKSAFGVFQKSQPPVQIEEDDPYTADDVKQDSHYDMIESADIVAKLDEIKVKSWSTLDELMTKSNIIIETATSQSNQIIESALTNLNIIEKVEKTSHQNVSQDNIYMKEDEMMNFF